MKAVLDTNTVIYLQKGAALLLETRGRSLIAAVMEALQICILAREHENERTGIYRITRKNRGNTS